MTNTERKASDLQSILSFLPFLLGYINRPLCFSHCNWPRLVVIFHGRRTSFRRDFLSRCNTTSTRHRIKKGSHRSVFEDAFRFEQKRLNGMPSSLSLFLSFSSLLRAVWKLNVKQSGTGRKGRETYGGAISWRGIDFYQDRGGGGRGRGLLVESVWWREINLTERNEIVGAVVEFYRVDEECLKRWRCEWWIFDLERGAKLVSGRIAYVSSFFFFSFFQMQSLIILSERNFKGREKKWARKSRINWEKLKRKEIEE